MTPVKGAGLRRRIRRRADEAAVGNRGELFRHGRDDFAGGSIVRVVVAGEPVARVLVFALRPRLPGLVWIAVVGADKIEPATRLTRIVDRDLDFFAGADRARHRNPQLAVRSFEGRGLATRTNCFDFEFGGVELEAIERAGNRGQSMGRGPRDFFRVEVERDLELDMTDVGGAVARPFCLDVLRLKRAASTGERDGKGLAIAKLLCQLIEKSRLMHGRDVMNRGGAAQTGKIECGAPRPAPPAG